MTRMNHEFPTLQAVRPEMWENTIRRVSLATGPSPMPVWGVGFASVLRTGLKEST